MSAIVNSPLALAAVTIALLALGIGAGVSLRARPAPPPREVWGTVLGVVGLCALAVVAVTQGLAR